ncbi:hypothetical protein Tco_1256002 [Tanacetum coccineum]
MTGNRKLFSSYKAYNGGNVIFGSNLRGNIIGKGTISNDSLKIDNVEHVDNLRFNLLSIGQICDNKCRVTFSEHDSEITKDGKVIGRGIRKKGLYVMKLLLKDLALYDNESWNDPRDFAKPVKAITLTQDVPSTSDHRLIKLKNQVQRLMEAHLAPTQPTQVNKITTSCEICSGPHDTQYCMEYPEQAFVEYASSRTDEAGGKWYTFKLKQNNLGDTYNPSWRSHPNLRWRQPQNSQNNFSNPPNRFQPNGSIPNRSFNNHPQSFNNQSSLEGLVSNFMASQDARLSKFEADFKRQQDEMTNKIDTVLKVITDRIAGALPSDMELFDILILKINKLLLANPLTEANSITPEGIVNKPQWMKQARNHAFFVEFECLLEISDQICPRFILEFYSQYQINYSDEGEMFIEFVIQTQFFSYSLKEFAQILDIPCEGVCVFTDKWSLDELAYGVPTNGPYQTNPSSPDDIISSIRIDSEGQVCRIRHEEEIDVLENQVLTREIEPTMKPLKEIIRENIFYLGRKPRKDRGTRRGRHSTSSSSTFDQPSSSHLNDDDDGNGEGTSRASTLSPIRYVNSLTNQIKDEQRGGLRSIGKGLRSLWRNIKK